MIRTYIQTEHPTPAIGDNEVLFREEKNQHRDKIIVTQYIAELTIQQDTATIEYCVDSYELQVIQKGRIPGTSIDKPMLKWLRELLYNRIYDKYIVNEHDFTTAISRSYSGDVFSVRYNIRHKTADDIYAEQFDYFINR